jgi:hypothetical protein
MECLSGITSPKKILLRADRTAQRVPLRYVVRVRSGPILSKKGSRGWAVLVARGRDSSLGALSATAIPFELHSGTRFYPLTVSSDVRSTFSTVSVSIGSRRPSQGTSALPHKAAQLSSRDRARLLYHFRSAAEEAWHDEFPHDVGTRSFLKSTAWIQACRRPR